MAFSWKWVISFIQQMLIEHVRLRKAPLVAHTCSCTRHLRPSLTSHGQAGEWSCGPLPGASGYLGRSRADHWWDRLGGKPRNLCKGYTTLILVSVLLFSAGVSLPLPTPISSPTKWSQLKWSDLTHRVIIKIQWENVGKAFLHWSATAVVAVHSHCSLGSFWKQKLLLFSNYKHLGVAGKHIEINNNCSLPTTHWWSLVIHWWTFWLCKCNINVNIIITWLKIQ